MTTFGRVVYVLLVAYFAVELKIKNVRAQEPPHCPLCDIRQCENVTRVQEKCPDAELLPDTCGCCRICPSTFGEPCGGQYGVLGTCEYRLICTANPSEYLNGANISGVCTRKVCTKNCTKKAESLVCGDDGRWYRNICALRQSKFCEGTGVREAESRRVCDTACRLLKAPEHGNITFSKGIAQTSVVNVSCQSPYTLEGDEQRTCSMGPRGAAWNGTQPVCRGPCDLHRCRRYEVCNFEGNEAYCVCESCAPCVHNRTRVCSSSGKSYAAKYVCASDGRSYPSQCHMRATACQSSRPDIYFITSGKCQNDELPRERER